jgi:hypothetical protein
LRELSSRYELEVSQISKRKKEFLEKPSMVFEVETHKKKTAKNMCGRTRATPYANAGCPFGAFGVNFYFVIKTEF